MGKFMLGTAIVCLLIGASLWWGPAGFFMAGGIMLAIAAIAR